MNDLLNKKCATCEGEVLPFDISEIHKYQKKVDGWDLNKNEKKIYYLEKKFTFKNFITRRASPRYLFWVGICKDYNYYSCNRGSVRK